MKCVSLSVETLLSLRYHPSSTQLFFFFFFFCLFTHYSLFFQCHIITKSMDAIVAWLREKETSAAICINLGLCNEYNMKFPDWKKVAALRQAVSKSEIIRKLHKELPKMQAPKVKGHYTQ